MGVVSCRLATRHRARRHRRRLSASDEIKNGLVKLSKSYEMGRIDSLATGGAVMACGVNVWGEKL